MVTINFMPPKLRMIPGFMSLLAFSDKIPGAPVPNIFLVCIHHILTFAAGAAVVTAGYGFGKFLFQKFLKNFTPANAFLYHFGFGQGALIFFMLLFGYLGLLYENVVYGIVLTGIILCFQTKNKIQLSGWNAGKFSFFEKTLLYIFIFASAVSLMGALTPETYFDSLVYHLSIPRWWLQHHKISVIPYVNQSYYPLNMETLFAAALSLSNSSAAKIINWFFAVANCVLIYETTFLLTRKRAVSIFSAMIYYTTPLLMIQTWQTGNEIGQGMWEILMVFNLLIYLKNSKSVYLALAGAAMGLSLGAKHPATITLFSVSAAFWLWNFLQKKLPFKIILKKYTLFLAFTVITASPWYLKTFITTGNPLFPQFAGKISDFRGDLRDNFNNVTTDQPAITQPKKIATAFWDVTMGKYQSSFPGSVYLTLLILIFLKKPLNNNAKFLLLFLIPYCFLWITVGGCYLRRFLPGLTSASVLLGTYFSIFNNSRNDLKKPLRAILAALFIFNVYSCLVMLAVGKGAFNFLLAREDKYTYIRQPRMTHPKYGGEVFRYINAKLPAEAGILFVAETRPFFAARPFMWGTAVMGKNPVVELANDSTNGDELYAKLQERGISHIFFSLSEHVRLKGYNMFYWTKKGKKVFGNFWKHHIALEYRSDYSYLYRLTETPHKSPQNLILKEIKRK
ncbi:MAG: hypothetical protein U9O97_06335 [Elusimicrobiota bacterium]|nr:hypothetical protein [Elusimicrobiota bacterium]